MEIGTLADYLVIAVIGICVCVGYAIKQINFIPNKYIPLIMMILGAGVNIWINDFIIVPEVLLGGMISGLASTGAYEAFEHMIINPLQEKKAVENA